jgi:ribonuclease VapC
MFLDASAIIAILAAEHDADLHLEKLEAAKGHFYSPVAAFESVAGLARIMTNLRDGKDAPVEPATLEHAEREVSAFFEAIGAKEIALGGSTTAIALQAARTFGKFVAHPARLNMGDCFAYACSKVYRAPLLFKGNDFPLTDIERA